MGVGQAMRWGRPQGESLPAPVRPRRYIRPSMLQHLLRRLVFDVPILNEFAKMPLKVRADAAKSVHLHHLLPRPIGLICISTTRGHSTCKCKGIL